MKLQKPKGWGKLIPYGCGRRGGDNINVVPRCSLPTNIEENRAQTVMTNVQVLYL